MSSLDQTLVTQIIYRCTSRKPFSKKLGGGGGAPGRQRQISVKFKASLAYKGTPGQIGIHNETWFLYLKEKKKGLWNIFN